MSFKTNILAAFAIGAIAILGAPSAHAKSETTVEIKQGDTLEKIATDHKTTYVRIFNANEQLTSPDLINAGDKVRIPSDDEQLPDRYAQVAAAQATAAASTPVIAQTATTYTTRNYSSAPVNSNSYYVGNGMWCTDWVHSKRADVPIYGNAGYNWVSAAQAQGKATGTTAQAGAVAVTNGHVAYVESVNSDGSYVVSEMGWNYKAGNYNQRTVQPGTFGAFIY
jgi:surface antigen